MSLLLAHRGMKAAAGGGGGYTGPTIRAVGTLMATSTSSDVVWPSHSDDDIGVLFVSTKGSDPTSTPASWNIITEFNGGGAAADRTIHAYWRRASGAMSNVTMADEGSNVMIGVIITVIGCPTGATPAIIIATQESSAASGTIPSGSVTGTQRLALGLVVSETDGAGGDMITGTFTNGDLTNLTTELEDGTGAGAGAMYYIVSGEREATGSIGSMAATMTATYQHSGALLEMLPA